MKKKMNKKWRNNLMNNSSLLLYVFFKKNYRQGKLVFIKPFSLSFITIILLYLYTTYKCP